MAALAFDSSACMATLIWPSATVYASWYPCSSLMSQDTCSPPRNEMSPSSAGNAHFWKAGSAAVSLVDGFGYPLVLSSLS
mmetsp:Transcript_19607/g.29310  ORF Transcript_19607/g.29310 Transcript_19607/m.29310 type:complete len:80 (-) Transcript_19607:82-321(-)